MMANEESAPSAMSIRQTREALFESRRKRNQSASSVTSTTANEAAAIQESLMRTQNLLKTELSRVSAVQNAIDDDDKLLRKTMDTQKTMNVKGAKKALTALERAKQHEQRVLTASVLFFWLVVAYIMWCRVIIRLPFVGRALSLIPVLIRNAEAAIQAFLQQ